MILPFEKNLKIFKKIFKKGVDKPRFVLYNSLRLKALKK